MKNFNLNSICPHKIAKIEIYFENSLLFPRKMLTLIQNLIEISKNDLQLAAFSKFKIY